MRSCFLLCLSVLSALGGTVAARGQNAPAQGSSSGPAYTLHTSARVVLTDVVVTDKEGKPVRGLDRSAFHLMDNKQPQALASFEEHHSDPTHAQAKTRRAAGIYTNDYLVDPPPVFNAVMLDTSTIGAVDQMWVDREMTRFIHALPPGEMLAIFVHANPQTVLLQDFTADHDLLLTALHKAVPRVPQPGSDRTTEISSLQQITEYLGNLPGRKNVIWFSGGSNLLIRADVGALPFGTNLQPLYDALEQARIAIYPVDVRGPILGVADQQLLMEDQARATGGKAFLNTNGLEEAAREIVDHSQDFYTLTYVPKQVKFDNSWHNVKVEVVPGRYNVSYRRGYYDDGSGLKTPTQKPRTRLIANGNTAPEPEKHAEPIIFSAQLISGVTNAAQSVTGGISAPRRGETTYTLHYRVPASAFTQSAGDEGDKVEIAAGLLVSNAFGRTVVRKSEKFTLTFEKDRLQKSPKGMLTFDQPVDLPAGEDSIFVMVWDPRTGRSGTLQVPVTVSRR